MDKTVEVLAWVSWAKSADKLKNAWPFVERGGMTVHRIYAKLVGPLPASSLRIPVWADPTFATQLQKAALAGDEAMKGEEDAIYSRYAAACPDLPEIAKKVVFLEERQPALDQMVEGNRLLNLPHGPITLTHIRPARPTL